MMVHMTPDEPPEESVENLARFLLQCAKEDPILIARSSLEPIANHGITSRPRPIKLPEAVAFPLPQPSQSDSNLEELVSIAVACANRAEDALRHAREVSWMARRKVSQIAAFAGVGVIVLVASVVLNRGIGGNVEPVVDNTSALHDVAAPSHPAVTQLADVRTDMTAPGVIPLAGRSAQSVSPERSVSSAPPAMVTASATPDPRLDASLAPPAVDDARPAAQTRSAANARRRYHPQRTRAYYAYRPYPGPFQQVTLVSPPVVIGQVVAGVRRGLNEIFH